MKKRVIMTSIEACKFSGSELHCLSLSKEFIRHGYEVTLVVIQKAYPLEAQFKRIGVKVYSVLENPPVEGHYDIFFAQHYPVANYLVDICDFTFDRLVCSSLSAVHEYEYLPAFSQKADLLSFVSVECKQSQLSKSYNKALCGKDKSFIFNNYADDSFFELYRAPANKELKRVAIISNHICAECLDFKKEAEKNGIHVELIGLQYTAVDVNAQFLSNFDLVITIGRTSQYCMAQGIPLYCYDIFGGPGYIDEANFETSMNYNFSGRGFERQLSGKELFDDITENYNKCIENIPMLREKAEKHFRLSEIFDKFIGKLNTKQAEKRSLSNYYNELEKVEHHALAEAVLSRMNTFGSFEKCMRSQVFFDCGNGLSEENSLTFSSACTTEICLELTLPENIKAVRFDPHDEECICTLKEIDCGGAVFDKRISEPSFTDDNGQIHFYHRDNQINISFNSTPPEKMCICFVLQAMDKNGYYEKMEALFTEKNQLQNGNAQLVENNTQLTNELDTENNFLDANLIPFEKLINAKIQHISKSTIVIRSKEL